MRNRQTANLLIGVLLCIAALLPVARAGERLALVIGNSDYVDRSVFPDLDLAAKDARLVADTLKRLGFEVIFAEDATKAVIYNRLLDFEEKIQEGGAALFYYAGHGVEFEKKNYLTGTNALFRDRDLLGEETLDADVIIGKMLRAGPKTAMVFLDCCRESPPQSWLTSHKKTRGANTLGLAPMQTRPGLVVGFSASAGNLANDTLGGEFGPYATALTKFMQSGEEINRVLQLTGREVNRLSQEEKAKNPAAIGLVIQEPAVYGQIYHDFFFSPGGKPVQPATANLTAAELAERDRMIADLQKKLAEMESREPTVEDYESAKVRMERAKKLYEVGAGTRTEYEDALEELRKMTPKSMTQSQPENENNFSVGSGMEGSKAGEVREFGGIEFVWCPPGKFEMGSPEEENGRDSDETQHAVALTSGFWMAKTECTQEQWSSVPGSEVILSDRLPLQFAGEKMPVVMVSWEDCQKWLKIANTWFAPPRGWQWALPTEAQWEYACRAGTRTRHAYGERVSQTQANFVDPIENEEGKIGEFPENRITSSIVETGTNGSGIDTEGVLLDKSPYSVEGPWSVKSFIAIEAGKLEANAWGIHDMEGNVQEWCAENYGAYIHDHLGQADTVDVVTMSPGAEKVVRGGSWNSSANDCRPAERNSALPSTRDTSTGFRPVIVPRS